MLHRASCKAKLDRLITDHYTLAYDLFSPTSVKSINHASYCLVITDDCTRFNKPNVKGVGYRWMFDIDYLTDSMNYIPVSLENQANPPVDEDAELIVVKNTAEKVKPMKSSTTSKKEEILTEPQHEKEASSTDTSEDNPKILAFRRELEEIALMNLGTVPENNPYYDYPSVHSESEAGFFDEACFDVGGCDDSWVQAMQEEWFQFKLQTGMGSVDHLRNEGKMVAQGYKQEEVIDYDEVLLCGRMELSGGQKLCMVHQAPRAWYATLSTFLEKHGYKRGTIDKTLFIKRDKKDIMLVQVNLKYLKANPIWAYGIIRESPFDLEEFSDSDYGGSNLDRKSTTGIAWICRCKEGVDKSLLWFTEIVDFLRGSNLKYALTNNPTIYDSLVKQFWQTATATTLADGTLELKATIDTIEYTITEASIRSKLQLADASGITMLPNNEIFEGMGHMGSKSGGWDQFGSNIATALICLSTDRVYNFSKLIFDGMVTNLKSKTRFLMYPRFLQMILDIQTENKHPYLAVTLTKKIFGNMKRGFKGVPRPLLPAMLSIVDPSAGQEAPSVTQPQPSSTVVPPTPPTTQPIPSEAITIPPLSQPAPPTPIAKTTTASPSPSPSPAHEPMEHTFEQPSTDQQPPTPRQEATTSQLMTRIGVGWDQEVLCLSEEEETEAQGRKTHDLDPLVSLVQELVTPSKTVNASGEEQVEDISPTTLEAAAILTKVQKIKVSVPSPDRGRREGKAPITEEEETQASRNEQKNKFFNERSRTSKAIILNALEKAWKRKKCQTKDKDTIKQSLKQCRFKESVLGKELTVDDYAKEVKHNFTKLVKQLDTYVPMNFEATKESLKRFGKELQTKTAKKLKFDDEGTQPTEEKIEEDKDDKPTKKTGKRRKQIARKGFHTDHDKMNREISDEANEKDDSTSGTKIPINPVHVATKSPSIANYKIIKQGRKGVYQIVRENGTDMVYISFRAMLTDISRDDLTELYRIVMKKHGMNEPEDEFEKRRKYPLSAEVCKAMLDKKLQGGKPDEDCYKLLKMMEKQAELKWFIMDPWFSSQTLDTPELMANWLIVELADRTVKYPKGIAKNILVGIGKFTFPVDFIIFDMPEDIKVPLILGRPFLSTSRAKINVYTRKITLRVGKEKTIFKSVKPASSIIKRVYMLSLRERMELNLEARLMGETLVLNSSLDPFLEDYIKLNDNQLSLREIKEMISCPHYGRTFSIVIDFAVLENMDAHRDKGMGDVIVGEPFLKEVGIKAKWFEGIITFYKGVK
ncbi:putative reverse transcriptase domain-containing protein [Tanacetum coccineum]